MLIMCLIAVTSGGNKTKHTHTHFAKNKANFTAVQIGIGIEHWEIFSPKYQNIGHWKFYVNSPNCTFCTTSSYSQLN